MSIESPKFSQLSPPEQVLRLLPGIWPNILREVNRIVPRNGDSQSWTYTAKLGIPVDRLSANISVARNPQIAQVVRKLELFECDGELPFGAVELRNPLIAIDGLVSVGTDTTVQFYEANTGLTYRNINGILQCKSPEKDLFQPTDAQSMERNSRNRHISAYLDTSGIGLTANGIPFASIPFQQEAQFTVYGSGQGGVGIEF